MGVLHRVVRKIRRDGLAATMRLAAVLVRERTFLHEEHFWYELETGGDRPRRELPEGLTVSLAGPDEVGQVAELGQDVAEAELHHSLDGELWITREGDVPLFACWIFPERSPVLAAPGGWLELPPGVAVLENSFTSPLARGRGIAPASWCHVADVLAERGVRSLITKVEVVNFPSRKAVTKAGFSEIGLMSLTRVAGHKWVSLVPAGSGLATELAQRL